MIIIVAIIIIRFSKKKLFHDMNKLYSNLLRNNIIKKTKEETKCNNAPRLAPHKPCGLFYVHNEIDVIPRWSGKITHRMAVMYTSGRGLANTYPPIYYFFSVDLTSFRVICQYPHEKRYTFHRIELVIYDSNKKKTLNAFSVLLNVLECLIF